MIAMPDFAIRAQADEMMDDFSITDMRLTRALENLRGVNRWLGGYAATRSALAPLLQRKKHVRLLDLGTGAADHPEHLVRWARQQGATLESVALDANPATVEHARAALDRRLPSSLRDCIRVDVGDAFDLSFEDGAFDVVHAALFFHHFNQAEAADLLREMNRVAREGIIVNDLHRHPLAYYGIKALGSVLPVSEMFRHDGPLSVLRGFRRSELQASAEAAGLSAYRVRWHWAFRWILTTV